MCTFLEYLHARLYNEKGKCFDTFFDRKFFAFVAAHIPPFVDKDRLKIENMQPSLYAAVVHRLWRLLTFKSTPERFFKLLSNEVKLEEVEMHLRTDLRDILEKVFKPSRCSSAEKYIVFLINYAVEELHKIDNYRLLMKKRIQYEVLSTFLRKIIASIAFTYLGVLITENMDFDTRFTLSEFLYNSLKPFVHHEYIGSFQNKWNEFLESLVLQGEEKNDSG